MNICRDLSKIVTNIKGLKSDSASPTDTWVLDIKETQINYTNTKVNTAFAKIFVSPDSLRRYIKDTRERYLEQLLIPLDALNYEIKVYEEIRDQLIVPKVSPCFVLMYGQGKNCSYDDMIRLLNANSPPIPREHFNRNILYTLENKSGRPSINSSAGAIYNNNVTRLDYNIIVSESLGGTKKFYEWFDKQNDTKDLWKVIFQVAIACYAMYCTRIAHNDLHSGNIFIADLGKEEMFIYRINGVDFVIKSRYFPKLYDFDRAYKIGNINYINEGQFCQTYSQCNQLVEQRDFVKIMCYVVNDLGGRVKTKIINAIAPTIDAQRILDATYNIQERGRKGCFLQTVERGKLVQLPDKEYKKFNPLPIIIQNIFSYIGETFTLEDIRRDLQIQNIYSCNIGFFDANGKLNKARNKKEIENIISDIKSKLKSPIVKVPVKSPRKSPTRRRISPRKRRSPSKMSVVTKSRSNPRTRKSRSRRNRLKTPVKKDNNCNIM